MASAFNLTAEINLRGPSNLGKVVSDIRRQLSTVTLDLNINPRSLSSIQQATGNIQSLNAALKSASTNAANLNTALSNLGTAIGNASRGMNNLGGGVNNIANQVNNARKSTAQITSQMEEFGKQSALAVRRFAAFSVATGGIYALSRAVASAYGEFLNFNKELVKLQQVTGATENGLKGITNEITRLSTGLGVTSSDLLTVSSTLAQAGLSATETKTALEALAKSALAPSFDNLNDTVEGSIALMRQFGISASDLESSLGSVNAVSAAFAVESGDIIKAIQRTGGVFAAASKGVSQGKDALNEFIAVFTSVRQTTRESAETIATGLRTIFTRIQRGSTIEALKEYGVVLTDLEGKFVGPYEAIRRLSEGLKLLDPRDLRFNQIVEELGGFRQIGKVIPLIQQFTVAQQALGVAQRGAGSLAEDAAIAQLSLSNKITKVREEFIALIRDIGQSKNFQRFVDISLQLASALITVASAAKEVLPALAALTAIKAIPAIGQFVGGFGRNIARKNDGGPVRAFASGGYVPGSGNRDTVPAMLTPGEFVIRKKAVKTLGVENLAKLNRGGVAKRNRKLSRSAPMVDDIIQASNTILPRPSAIDALIKAGGGAVDIDRTIKRTIGDKAYGSAKTKGQQSTALDKYFKDPQRRLSDVKSSPLTSFGVALKEAVQSGQLDPSRLSIISKSRRVPGIAEYLNSLFGIPTQNMIFTQGADKAPALEALREKGPRIDRVKRFAFGGPARSTKGIRKGARSGFKELTEEEIAQLSTEDLIAYGKKLARDVFTRGGAGIATSSKFIPVPQERIIPELESSLQTYLGQKGFWQEQISPFGRPSKSIDKKKNKMSRETALSKQESRLSDEVAARSQEWTKIRANSSIDNYLMSALEEPVKSDYMTVRGGGSLSKTFHNTRLRQAVNKALESFDDFDYSPGNIDKFVSAFAAKKFADGGIVQKFKDGKYAKKIPFEEKIKAGMIDKKTYRFGLVGLQSGIANGQPINDVESIDLTRGKPKKEGGQGEKKYKVKLHKSTFYPGVGSLDDKDAIETNIKNSFANIVKDTSSTMASSLKSGKSANQATMNKILTGAPLASIIGTVFEAALASLGSPFINKPEKAKSMDFPLGLGSVAEDFGIPPNIPTDATRTIAGSGKSVADMKGQIGRFLGAVETEQFTKGFASKFIGTQNIPTDKIQVGIQSAINKYTAEVLAENITKDLQKDSTALATATEIRGKKVVAPVSAKQLMLAAKTGKTQTLLKRLPRSIISKYFASGSLGSPEQYAYGGGISGQDTVPALLTPGEFVINKKAARKIGSSKLHQLNKADKTQGFNKGGAVGNIQSFATGGGVQNFAAGGMAQVFSGLVSVISKLIPSFNQLSTTTATVTKNMAAQQVATFRQQGLSGAALKAAMVNAGYASGGINNMRSRNQKAANQTANQTNDSGGGLKSLGLMFIGPMIAEAINSSVTKNFGKTGAVVGAGITSVVSGATVGSAFGAPGAIVGAAAGLASAFLNAESAADAYTKAQNELKIETESSKLEKALQNLSQNVGDTASNISAASDALMAIMSSGAENRQIVTREAQGLLGLEEGTIGRYIGGFFRDVSANFSETYFGTTPETIDTTALNRSLLSESLPQATALQRAIETQLTSGISLEDVFKNLKLTGADANPETKRTLAIARGKDEVTKIEADIAAAETKRYTGGDIRANGTVETAEEEKTRKIEALNAKRAAAIDRLSSEELKEIEIRNKNAAAAKAVSVEIDMFAQQIKKLGGVISRAGAEFAEAGRLRDIATSSGLGEAKIAGPSRLDENVLGNLTAYSTDELVQALDRTSETLGFSPEFSQQIKTSAVAQQTLESELPRILLEAAQSQKTPGGEVDKSITDRITEVFDPLKEALGEEIDSTTLDTALKNVVTALGKSATSLQGKSFEEIAASVPELQGLLKPLADVTSTVESSLKAYNDMLSTTNNEMNNYTNHLGRILDLQIQASSIELDAANNLKQALGKGVSVTELNRPFENAIDALTSTQGPNGKIVRGTGTLDPEEIARRLAQADKEFIQTQTAGPKKDETLDQFYTRLTKNKTTVDNLAKAQEMLANNTTKASNALSRIGQLRQAQESRRGTFEEILKNLNNPEWIAEFNGQVAALVRVRAGVGNISDIGPALEAFRTRMAGIDPLKREEETEKLYDKLFDIFQKNPLTKDIDREQVRGLVLGQNGEMTAAIDQYNVAIEDQKKATLLLSERMEGSSDIFKTKIIEAADAFLNRMENAGNLPLEARPVGFGVDGNPAAVAAQASRGGMIYASKGRLVDFQPKGTDTVPAMLTPGEFVVNARATKNNMGLLKAINNGSNTSGYSKGGVVYLADGGLIDPELKSLISVLYDGPNSKNMTEDDLYNRLKTEGIPLIADSADQDVLYNFKDSYEKRKRKQEESIFQQQRTKEDEQRQSEIQTRRQMDAASMAATKADLDKTNMEAAKAKRAAAESGARLEELRKQEKERRDKAYESILSNANKTEEQKLADRRKKYPEIAWSRPKTEADLASIAAGTNPGVNKAQKLQDLFSTDPLFKEYRYNKNLTSTIKNKIAEQYSDDLDEQMPSMSSLLSLARRTSLDFAKQSRESAERKQLARQEQNRAMIAAATANLVNTLGDSKRYGSAFEATYLGNKSAQLHIKDAEKEGAELQKSVGEMVEKAKNYEGPLGMLAYTGDNIISGVTSTIGAPGGDERTVADIKDRMDKYKQKQIEAGNTDFSWENHTNPVIRALGTTGRYTGELFGGTVGSALNTVGGLGMLSGAGFSMMASDLGFDTQEYTKALEKKGFEALNAAGSDFTRAMEQTGRGVVGLTELAMGYDDPTQLLKGKTQGQLLDERNIKESGELGPIVMAAQTARNTAAESLIPVPGLGKGASPRSIAGRMDDLYPAFTRQRGIPREGVYASLFDDNKNVKFPKGSGSNIKSRLTFGNAGDLLTQEQVNATMGHLTTSKKGFFGVVDLAETGLAGLQDFTIKGLMGAASTTRKGVIGTTSIAGKGVMGAGKGAMGAARGLLQFEKSPILNSLRKIGVLPKINWMKKQARKTARAQAATARADAIAKAKADAAMKKPAAKTSKEQPATVMADDVIAEAKADAAVAKAAVKIPSDPTPIPKDITPPAQKNLTPEEEGFTLGDALGADDDDPIPVEFWPEDGYEEVSAPLIINPYTAPQAVKPTLSFKDRLSFEANRFFGKKQTGLIRSGKSGRRLLERAREAKARSAMSGPYNRKSYWDRTFTTQSLRRELMEGFDPFGMRKDRINPFGIERSRRLEAARSAAAKRGSPGIKSTDIVQSERDILRKFLDNDFEQFGQYDLSSYEAAKLAMSKSAQVRQYLSSMPQSQIDAFVRLSTQAPIDKRNSVLQRILERAGETDLKWLDETTNPPEELQKILREMAEQSEAAKSFGKGFNPAGAYSPSKNRIITTNPSNAVHEVAHFAAKKVTYKQLKEMLPDIDLDAFLKGNEFKSITDKLGTAYTGQNIMDKVPNELFTVLNEAMADPKTSDLFGNSPMAKKVLADLWRAITYKKGGVVYASKGTLVPYQSKGTDTVPAMLTPGEFVVNARATKNNLGLLRSINGGAKGYSKGGVTYLQDGGMVGDLETKIQEAKNKQKEIKEQLMQDKDTFFYWALSNKGGNIWDKYGYAGSEPIDADGNAKNPVGPSSWTQSNRKGIGTTGKVESAPIPYTIASEYIANLMGKEAFNKLTADEQDAQTLDAQGYFDNLWEAMHKQSRDMASPGQWWETPLFTNGVQTALAKMQTAQQQTNNLEQQIRQYEQELTRLRNIPPGTQQKEAKKEDPEAKAKVEAQAQEAEKKVGKLSPEAIVALQTIRDSLDNLIGQTIAETAIFDRDRLMGGLDDLDKQPFELDVDRSSIQKILDPTTTKDNIFAIRKELPFGDLNNFYENEVLKVLGDLKDQAPGRSDAQLPQRPMENPMDVGRQNHAEQREARAQAHQAGRANRAQAHQAERANRAQAHQAERNNRQREFRLRTGRDVDTGEILPRDRRENQMGSRAQEQAAEKAQRRQRFRSATGRGLVSGRIGGEFIPLTDDEKAANRARAERIAAGRAIPLEELTPEQLANRERAERIASGRAIPLEELNPEQLANRERAERIGLNRKSPENRSPEDQERLGILRIPVDQRAPEEEQELLNILRIPIDQRTPEQIARLEELREKKRKRDEALNEASRKRKEEGVVYASKGRLINYQPRGTDTVPAMLTPGEFVVNRKATKQNLGLLQQINSQNYNAGGFVKPKYFADGGVNGGNISSSGGSSGGVLSVDSSQFDSSVSSFDSIVGQLSGSIQEFISGGSAIISGFSELNSIVSGFTALSTAAALLGGASTGLTTSIGEFNTAVGKLQSALDSIPDSINLNVTGSIPVNVTVTVNGGQGLGEKLEQFADDIYNTISTELSNKTNGGIKLDLRTSKK